MSFQFSLTSREWRRLPDREEESEEDCLTDRKRVKKTAWQRGREWRRFPDREEESEGDCLTERKRLKKFAWQRQEESEDDFLTERNRVKEIAWQREREWRRSPDRKRKRVWDHRSAVLKGFAHRRKTELPSIRGWAKRAKRARRRVEMRQIREMWRSCTRHCGSWWGLFWIEFGCWLLASTVEILKEWCG